MNKKIKLWIYRNKEGFGIGTALAILLWFMKWNSFIPIKNTYLNLLTLIIILGGAGALLDSVIDPLH